MADLTLAERAKLMAQSLNIDPNSYTGQETRAIIAMALIGGYRQMIPADKQQILYIISVKLGFGASNPMFFYQCQTAVIMMTANPAWVPASLTDDELGNEVQFWSSAKAVLNALGAGGIIFKGGKSILSDVEKSVLTGKPGDGFKLVTKPLKAGLTPNVFTALKLFGAAAYAIADASLNYLNAEQTRRDKLNNK